MSVIGALGEATLHNNVYQPILELMGDYRIYTLHYVERALASASNFDCVLRALMILITR
jgi:hypothetical protein